jgi:phosphoribosyl 1,2-cyclic phosphate phosphodiesterase
MSYNLRITILGCGSSGGVPRVGGDWGVCDPDNPKNRRRRCSILVEKWKITDSGDLPPESERTIVLVDTSPDLREQLLSAKVSHVDALLFTHDHADQSHGIDDMRAIAYRMRARIPTYMDEHTKVFVFRRFEYCFEIPEGRVHPAILELQPLIKSGDIFEIDGPGGVISVQTLGLSHGSTPSLGFKFDNRAVYTPDVWDIDDDVMGRIDGSEVWIVDALRYAAHPTHAHADKTLSWLARTQCRKAVLTNLHIDMDYDTLSLELLPAQEPAYDGMLIDISIT